MLRVRRCPTRHSRETPCTRRSHTPTTHSPHMLQNRQQFARKFTRAVSESLPRLFVSHYGSSIHTLITTHGYHYHIQMQNTSPGTMHITWKTGTAAQPTPAKLPTPTRAPSSSIQPPPPSSSPAPLSLPLRLGQQPRQLPQPPQQPAARLRPRRVLQLPLQRQVLGQLARGLDVQVHKRHLVEVGGVVGGG